MACNRRAQHKVSTSKISRYVSEGLGILYLRFGQSVQSSIRSNRAAFFKQIRYVAHL